MKSILVAGLLALSVMSSQVLAEAGVFSQMTEEQKTELLELEEVASSSGFVALTLAMTSNFSSLVGRCGYGLVETTANGVIGTLPAGSLTGNMLMQWLRDGSYNITADELDLKVREDLDVFSWPEFENEAELGQTVGAAIGLVLDMIKYFWDYGDLEIEQQHWQKLDGAMLAYINSRDVTLGATSECQQSWRRLKVLFGLPAEVIISK